MPPDKTFRTRTATEIAVAPEYLLLGDSYIIPVANISHIIRPDDTVHVWLKNGQELRYKMGAGEWKDLQELFVKGL